MISVVLCARLTTTTTPAAASQTVFLKCGVTDSWFIEINEENKLLPWVEKGTVTNVLKTTTAESWGCPTQRSVDKQNTTTLHKWIGTLHLDLHEIRCICVSMVLKVVFKAISLSRDKSYENPMYTAFIWSSLNPNTSWFLGFCIEERVQNLGGKLIVSDLVTLNAEKPLVAIEKKWSQHIRSQYSTWILLLILHIQNIYIYINVYICLPLF